MKNLIPSSYKKRKTFVSTWKTDNIGLSASNQIKLPLTNVGGYDFVVKWGDGTKSRITNYNQAEVMHTYTTAGTYTLTITGYIKGWRFNNAEDRLKILSISRWGCLRFNQNSAFYGCANLTLNSVSDLINLSDTTTIAAFFRGCNLLTSVGRINEWNTSHITLFSGMFQETNLYNQNLSFDTTNATSMVGMFRSALSFNGTLSFNTPNLITVNDFLNGAVVFNQPITFDLSKVITLNYFHWGNTAFNQVVNYNVPLATSLNSMMRGCVAFNSSFSINCPIVTNIDYLFYGATVFNHVVNIGTPPITTMNSSFANATNFDQDISGLNFSAVSIINNLMLGKTYLNYSTANYDALLIKLAATGMNGRTLGMGTIRYTAAASAARTTLTSTKGWTISDGGLTT